MTSGAKNRREARGGDGDDIFAAHATMSARWHPSLALSTLTAPNAT